MGVFGSVSETVGKTPLVRLANIEKEFKALLDSFKLKYTIKNNGVNKIA